MSSAGAAALTCVSRRRRLTCVRRRRHCRPPASLGVAAVIRLHLPAPPPSNASLGAVALTCVRRRRRCRPPASADAATLTCVRRRPHPPVAASVAVVPPPSLASSAVALVHRGRSRRRRRVRRNCGPRLPRPSPLPSLASSTVALVHRGRSSRRRCVRRSCDHHPATAITLSPSLASALVVALTSHDRGRAAAVVEPSSSPASVA
ncbi:hypothetical protein [Oryza sativa Japonica Group]|jgi:hypothetical protein|uniref:Os01g0848550 protein n=5 Tax=Oryza TaxID=4527 RepID=A0A0P0VAF6_ORYSJ|nr:uncharacterized protein LOC9267523 [Oryza sativa Japonica Group]EEC71804.1 hypothetical protein OsI_04435 [Oryza sativa Indica Group]EEE55671.1 hypothetical protein OsJ_04078 [Oryza sativa Japonica Group]KAF2953318.1 hypothetical protein DAI22_01g400266 [Oryza sativa Japonica Group]BAD82670.1 hypothetical protein [Oryza sativa Japonica Group]BAH91383.1 Os01g0848550 [Oryza sativa Japonica Group]|eukprot:NP_001172653.1 Os01g0848550 [Oryza sativa Japonica Group]